MKLVVRNGAVRFVYDDGLHAALKRRGKVTITRASAVEPATEYCQVCRQKPTRFCARMQHPTFESGWCADLSPVEPGVMLGPFESRLVALDEERKWIEAHGL